MLDDFNSFFQLATGHQPYPFQSRLAERHADFVRVETGLGKTEGLVLGWLWRRLRDPSIARRLIYVLPMRSLVEQTVARIQDCIDRLQAGGVEDLPRVEAVMGGDIGDEWYQNPEKPWIVVGTQDALLSRALNRGYAMSRFQWAMTFGAMNNDANWVIDEVQLQGIGAVTATQLQSLRERFGTYVKTQTTLASATLDTSWFESADYCLEGRVEEFLTEDDRAIPGVCKIVDARKTLERFEAKSESDVACAVLERHRRGTRTLVVVNTVERAKDIFRRLQRSSPEPEVVLLHSRFRPGDRAVHADRLRAEIDPTGPGCIVVATQVVEAGIDVTSATLFTEAAPWSSLVQRFGRCNRRGEERDAGIVWIDFGEPTAKNALPYDTDEIVRAREILSGLVGANLAPSALPEVPIRRGKGLVLRSPELLDLFDTSTDLAGHDVDVSPYIRDASDFTAAVFWRDDAPTSEWPPRREELCPITVTDLRKLIDELRARGDRDNVRIANQFGRAHDEWIPLIPDAVRPGLLVWLQTTVGRYDSAVGFDNGVMQRVPPVTPNKPEAAFADECDSIDGDRGSEIGVAQTITQHARYTHEEASILVRALALAEPTARSVMRAALWHDVGKAHAVFQETMRKSMPNCAPGELWAKSTGHAGRHSRQGFRHELPGALVYLIAHDGEADAELIAFLIAAHHGKFRVSAEPLPYEKGTKTVHVFGNCEGDRLPSVQLLDGETSPEIAISLAPFRIATDDGSTTWVERVMRLRDSEEHGPFRLAFLELLVRIADWRASRRAAEERQ